MLALARFTFFAIVSGPQPFCDRPLSGGERVQQTSCAPWPWRAV
jgi:hypothetical protein